MKQFLNILVLSIFINFLALPSIAIAFGIDIPTTNIVLSEEETSTSGSFLVSEKNVSKPLCIYDFVKFFEPISARANFALLDDGTHISPPISMVSPPPEFS